MENKLKEGFRSGLGAVGEWPLRQERPDLPNNDSRKPMEDTCQPATSRKAPYIQLLPKAQETFLLCSCLTCILLLLRFCLWPYLNGLLLAQAPGSTQHLLYELRHVFERKNSVYFYQYD
jgi:hypothetical protein